MSRVALKDVLTSSSSFKSSTLGKASFNNVSNLVQQLFLISIKC